MALNRSCYAALTLCLFGCGSSTAIKDDSLKAPTPCECVSSNANDETDANDETEAASPKVNDEPETVKFIYKARFEAHRPANRR